MRDILKPYIEAGRIAVGIPDYCTMMGITSPTYYSLRKRGLTPQEIRIPGTSIVRISIEEIDRWLTAREKPRKAEAAGIAAQRQKLKLASVAANSRQLHKLNHKAKTNGDAADTPPDTPQPRKRKRPAAALTEA